MVAIRIFGHELNLPRMNLETILINASVKAFHELYGKTLPEESVQVQKTRKEFSGDLTLVVFPLLRFSGKSPEATANEVGEFILNELPEFSSFSVVKGFLNLKISSHCRLQQLAESINAPRFGFTPPSGAVPPVMVEYSSPNTNKPLHLGHIRNNLLGYSISRILEATGRKVIKVNLVNDRGIHICKSMLAWKKYGNGETPESSGMKGDHLVGKYYVRFDKEYKAELASLQSQGKSPEEAEKQSTLMAEAREMLRRWEAGDPDVKKLWYDMNHWVYQGFDETYRKLGVDFDRIYYESETFMLGKELVEKGLAEGVLYRREDGSVWADLTEDGLDHKLLLRSDGTSVYMTQDLGTAHQRFTEYPIDRLVYVVGNEQNYHFQVLALVLKKLGFSWAGKLYHLSYGMVELPDGKMKSREGTVVDADDLIEGMVATAREMSDELGKLGEIDAADREQNYQQVGLSALKYFILKVDPRKNMTFNPAESIDFNGNTGPFIQYTYARIRSVLRKAGSVPSTVPEAYALSEKEDALIGLATDFPSIIQAAGDEMNPAVIANYLFELAKEFNQFYHEHSILNADSGQQKNFRLLVSSLVANIIKDGMYLLGMEVPERM
jgi:arginyl-tRNA synthetase